tara:strand:+ start:293 stop:559 length:267 start_codon:yes stop_codon:yes gene_type:complete
MQTISTTELRTDLTGLLQNIDKPLAITKRGKILGYLVGPAHDPLKGSEESSVGNSEEDSLGSDDWDMSMDGDFERYLSGITPENRVSY